MDLRSDVIKDLEKRSRDARRVDRERAELFTVLLRHPAWKLYEEVLDAQIQTRADMVLAPAGSLEGAMVLEYVKGAMSGLLLARGMPNAIIADMKSAALSSGEEE